QLVLSVKPFRSPGARNARGAPAHDETMRAFTTKSDVMPSTSALTISGGPAMAADSQLSHWRMVRRWRETSPQIRPSRHQARWLGSDSSDHSSPTGDPEGALPRS